MLASVTSVEAWRRAYTLAFLVLLIVFVASELATAYVFGMEERTEFSGLPLMFLVAPVMGVMAKRWWWCLVFVPLALLTLPAGSFTSGDADVQVPYVAAFLLLDIYFCALALLGFAAHRLVRAWIGRRRRKSAEVRPADPTQPPQ